MSIPKKIHYVWLGDKPVPKKDREYIEGWRKLNPGFEVRHWTEKDVKNIDDYPLIKVAIKERRWALAADIIRMYAVYTEGGVYMDTDVELLKPLAPFMKYDGFASWESNFWFTTSIFGAKKHSEWIGKVLKRYEGLTIKKKITTETFIKTVHSPSVYAKDIYGIKLDGKTREYADGKFAVFAQEYFAPKHYLTGEVKVTDKTVAFHHYASTWHTRREKMNNDAVLILYRTLKKSDYAKLERMYNRSMEKKIRKELP